MDFKTSLIHGSRVVSVTHSLLFTSAAMVENNKDTIEWC